MDTGSTLYQKLQRSLARQKKKKFSERSKKSYKTRRENQRKKNEEDGNGYHTDRELKRYQQQRVDAYNAFWDRRRRDLAAWNKKQHEEAVKRKKERERLKKIEDRKKAKEREKERAKKERMKEREKRKRKEKLRKYWSRRLKKHNIGVAKPYIIYLAQNGKSYRWKDKIGRYKNLELARQKIKELKEAEKDVIFERLNKTYEDGTMESNYEYVIFKDVKDGEAKSAYLKNEYGKYVEHNVEIRGKNYEIIEKYPAKVEDDVWVFGCNPRNDRKTFAWVFDNVLNEGFSSSHDMKRIYLYYNKVVFRNDDNEIDIVICKVAADAVRFYNLLQAYGKKGPYLFMGNVDRYSALCPDLEKLLKEKTGWTTNKLRRKQNRF